MLSLKSILVYLILLTGCTFLFANNNSSAIDGIDPESPLVVYCTPSATTPWNDYIEGVTFGSISNTSQSDPKSANTTPRGYSDYTNLSNDVTIGNTYPITINARYAWYNPNASGEGFIRIWVDLNGDDDFDDTGELVVDHIETLTFAQTNTGYTINLNVPVPAGAALGPSRMRIVAYRDASNVPPCTTGNILGEFEDYGVTILGGNDTDPPTVNLTTPASTVYGLYTVDVNFDESVSGLDINDFTVSNGTLSNLQGTGANYTVDVTPVNAGNVSLQLPANQAQDGAGNGNIISNILNTTYSTSPPGVYCAPGPTTPWNEYITGVVFGNIMNANQSVDEEKSANETPVGVHDYTDLITTVEAGSSYDINVTGKFAWFSSSFNGLGNLRIWVDFNNDGDFDDAGELPVDQAVTLLSTMNGINYIMDNNISIPVDAVTGNTRMRLLISQDANPQGPCETTAFRGEYEDYSLNIVPMGAIENPDFDIAWAKCPANVLTDGKTKYRKLYNNPYEYLRACNTLRDNEDGWLEFTLLDDIKSNGDWIYIGLIDADKTINNTGTTDPDFLFGIRSDTETPQQNVLVLEGNIGPSFVTSGGNQGDKFKIAREGSDVKYYMNDVLIYTRVPDGTNVPNLELEPVFYILQPGADQLVNVDFNVSENLLCDEFQINGHFTKQEATPSSGGAIDLDIRGGQPPYTFMWSNSAFVGSNPVNVPAGTHTVTVTDDGGDTKSQEIDIFTMYDIEWETIESGVNHTGDIYILSDANNNDLFSCNTISADGTALIKIRHNEDINNPTNNEFNLFFKDTEFRPDALGKYGYKFNVSGAVLLVDDLQYNQGSPEVFGPDLNYNSEEYEYTIMLKNREISFFKNQKFLFKAPILAEIENFRVELNLLSSDSDGLDVDIQVSDECLPTPNTEQFVDLKRRLDASFIQVEDDYIRFRYNEDYAVIDGPDSNLECKIFDWHRNERYSISLNKEYGVNWKELKIPNGGLVENEFYILEVHNANKGEIYYLRFKYKCPPGGPCSG